MFYKNPISRFILRKHWLRRVKMRLAGYSRNLTKNSFDDLKFIFEGKPVGVVVDAGANIGFVTFQFLKRFPEARIHAFEPNPSVFETLKAAYADEPRVHPHNLGVARSKGVLTFNLSPSSGSSSFLQMPAQRSAHHPRDPGKPVQVNVTDLGSFVLEHQLKGVNILKLDIEGYELEALKGAEKLLDEQAIDAVYTEVGFVRSLVGQPLFHEITKYLEDHDYHLFNLEGEVGETAVRQATIGNATYISGRHRRFLEEKHGKENCGW